MANDIRFTIVVNGAEGAASQVERVGRAAHSASSRMQSLTGNMSVSTGAMLRFASASAGVYFGILGIAQVLGQAFNRGIMGSIAAASLLEESLNKSRVVFGDFSADIEKFAKDAPLMMAQQQAVEFAGTFGNMFTAMGMTQGHAADMSKSILQLGADLSSFNNIPVVDALEKIRAGLVGEIEPLRTVGVNINAEMVEAEGLRLGLRKLNEELTASGKAQAALSLIMQQTKSAQGDAARTATGYANSTRQLQSAIKQLGADIGTELLPEVTKLVRGMTDWINQNGPQIARDLGNAFRNDVIPAVEATVDAIKNVKSWLDQVANSTPIKVVVDVVAQMKGDNMAINVLGAVIGGKIAGLPGAAAVFGAGALGNKMDIEAERGQLPTLQEVARFNADIVKAFPNPLALRNAVQTYRDILDDMATRRAQEADRAANRADVVDTTARMRDAMLAEIASQEAQVERPRSAGVGAPTSQSKGGAARSPLERITDTFNKQLVEAYIKGGDAQVEAVRKSQDGIREQMNRVASEVSTRFGIPFEDAMLLAFDAVLRRAEEWAKAMERIANDNMHEQIAAYLKGGKGAVDATKASQTQLLADAMKNALAFREAMGLPFEQLGEIFPQMLDAMKDKAKKASSDSQQTFGGLLRFLVARRTGMGRDNGLTDAAGNRLPQPQMAAPIVTGPADALDAAYARQRQRIQDAIATDAATGVSMPATATSTHEQTLNLGGVQITVLMPPGATTSDIGAALSAAGAEMERRPTLAEVG